MADMSTTNRPSVALSVWSSRCFTTPASSSTSGPSGLRMITAPWSCSWIFIANPPADARASARGCQALCRRLQGQRHGERATLVDLRLHGDVAAVHPNDLAGQRQTQAGAGDLRHAGVL